MLAGQFLVGEVAVLDPPELAGVQVESGGEALHAGKRLGQVRGRPVEGGDGLVEAARRLGRRLIEQLARLAQALLGVAARILSGERGAGLVQGLDQLLAVHQPGALLRQALGLARLRVEGGQLLHRVAQEGLLPARLGQGLLCLPVARQGRLPGLPEARGFVRRLAQAAEGVEEGPVTGAVHEAVLLELALDLDQRRPQAAQQADRHRLVVDEGAAAPVGAQVAAQDQAALLQLDAVLVQARAHRMLFGDVEDGGDRGLGCAGAQQAGVGAAAEGETQGVEQDRLAGPGLAGQRAESTVEGEIELVDQDQVPDRQALQHSGARPQNTESQVRENQPFSLSGSGITSTPVSRA